MSKIQNEPFETPNLDGITTDPDEMHEISEVLLKLHRYASAKEQAMRFRLAGDIKMANEIEALCDTIYQELPQWAQW